jgi:hypothetical protein
VKLWVSDADSRNRFLSRCLRPIELHKGGSVLAISVCRLFHAELSLIEKMLPLTIAFLRDDYPKCYISLVTLILRF